jgi:hypothetical protein
MSEWPMPNDFQPVVGYWLQFRTKLAPGSNGEAQSDVVKLVPPVSYGC